MTDITMPNLSDSMEDGTVLRWLKTAGDTVAEGEELLEIETDKATVTYESPAAGILGDLVAEGGSYPVGAVIATVGGASSSAAAADATRVSVKAPADEETSTDPTPAVVAAPALGAPANSSATSNDPGGPASSGSPRATPLARRVAAVHGIDLKDVDGSGPRGRITRSDVAAAAGHPTSVLAATTSDSTSSASVQTPPVHVHRPSGPSAASSAGIDAEKTMQKLSRPQQVIARRMAQSKATVPHFQVQTEAALDALLELRGQLKAQTDRPPSINDFIVKACALALREFPLANGSYRDEYLELHDRVHVGIAVATDDALIVPTITDADWRSLGAIASEARRLATAVREGTITPAELSGATFTVSNLGTFGMTAIWPVVNVPQAAILGVGAARPVLRREDGEIVELQLMTLTLSCDHRVLYGANAAQFLSRVRELLEIPLQLAL